MLDHRIQDLVIGDVGAREAEFGGDRLLRAQSIARADPRLVVKALQFVARGRRLQIFDNGRLGPRLPKNLERLAGCSTEWIVINRYGPVTESPRTLKPNPAGRPLNAGESRAEALSRCRNDVAPSSLLRA